MEKFDKYIKTKLEERRAVPSERSWDQIKEGLPLDTKSGRTRKYVWTIAASFVGLLLASVLFYQQKPTEITVDPLAGTTRDADVPLKESKAVEITKMDKKEVQEITEIPVVINSGEEAEQEMVITEVTPKQEMIQPIKDMAIEKPLDVISIKANEVFAQVEKLERLSLVEVTDAEIDSLLRVAQKEIITEKIFAQNGEVDAMALLTEVEDELDETVRDQIFDALKEGYLKLRTAVADRNK